MLTVAPLPLAELSETLDTVPPRYVWPPGAAADVGDRLEAVAAARAPAAPLGVLPFQLKSLQPGSRGLTLICCTTVPLLLVTVTATLLAPVGTCTAPLSD